MIQKFPVRLCSLYDEYGLYGLLGCEVMQFGGWVPTFQRNILHYLQGWSEIWLWIWRQQFQITTLKFEAVLSSETLISIHQNTRRHIPEDLNIKQLLCSYITQIFLLSLKLAIGSWDIPISQLISLRYTLILSSHLRYVVCYVFQPKFWM
jgi:hypothetical protein